MVELHDLDQLLHSSELFDTTLKDEVLELHEGERREVATLFADIKGFTAMSEYLDPEDVRMILDRLLQLFAHCITQYGGYVDKYEGDLVMALFGAKVASERDTERAIHAALAMLDKLEQFNALLAKKPELRGVQLGVRIGINTGLVTTGRIAEKREGDFTVYGDAVNLASRMESSAPVNRIMLPEATMRSVSDVFEFEDYGEIEVKGKSDLVSVFLVKGLKARQAQRWSHRQTVYVGRQSELAALQQAYQAVAQHIQQAEVACQKVACQPILVGIKGAAGMGKSRLLYEFLAARRHPRFVLQAATPHVIQNPYCVFTTLIKQYLNISHFDAPQVVKRKLETSFKTLEAYLPDSEELQTLRDIRPLIGFLIGVKYPDVRLESSGHDVLQPHLQAAIRHFLEHEKIGGQPVLPGRMGQSDPAPRCGLLGQRIF
jgi:adenylate cyclase